ncbi:O-antigen ligase family protein [Pararoseomonas indoligenes]|uniref:O-antigen ligase family protein n=1 Tax=Roseomonas indoligenes TaxID=2820811 RepID=A0A940S8M2_9PROT|nr:O-antigen ligase family protein [Pararoseomonas indoligenes]MBP0496244.1 O-antigen ligase family protein [Pararoseomonas indoligenes]
MSASAEAGRWYDAAPHPVLSRDAGFAVAVALLLPLAMYSVGLGGLTRIAYPLSALAAGWYLWSRKSPWYVGLCVWLFCASPLIRRLHDYGAGFDVASPILLAPYLAMGWAVLSGLGLCIRGGERLATPFAIFVLCVLYGFVIAVLDGRLVSGAVDLLKWTAGPFMALYLITVAAKQADHHRVVVTSFIAAAPAMACYGILQFISPLPWDLEWSREMLQMGVEAMGRPEPFELRVYATMHSPGSLGSYLMVGLLTLIGAPLPIALPGIVLAVLGLALAQYRTIWAGSMVGLLVLALAGPAREKFRLVLGALLLVTTFGSLVTIPEVQETLSQRVRSITELQSDASGEDRLSQYTRFLDEDRNLLVGQGIASNGFMRQLDKQKATVIDSGILETYAALGLFVGTILLACLACICWRTITLPAALVPHAYLYRSVVLATAVQIPFGTVYVGESGFTMWVFIGLACAAARSLGTTGGNANLS